MRLVLAREVDDRLVGAVDHAVGVLDLAELAALGVLDGELGTLERHVGDPDEVELALPAQRLERLELLGGGDAQTTVLVGDAQVDEIHPLHAQRAQVVLDTGAQLLG